METIKLTEEDKKILNKYNLFLRAVVGDEGIYGYAHISEDEGIYDFSGFCPDGYYGYNRRDEIDPNSEGYDILYNIMDEYLGNKSNEFTNYLYCDNCTGYGMVNISYKPDESKFEIILEITVRGEESHEHMYTFDELKNQTQNEWGQRYNELKKLGDPTFIEKMKNDYGNILELTYDGGGDSGQINDDGETATSSVRINQDIEYIGYEIIDIRYSGWENNEGGDGRIIFNFEDQTVNIYHNYYVENSESEDMGELKLI